MKPRLLCILGETASGKDTVLKTALKESNYDIKEICSYTDRPIRDDETDGIEHYFLTTSQFNKLKKSREQEILAYTHIKKKETDNKGYQYMTFIDQFNSAQLYIIDPNGLKNLKKLHGDKIDIVAIYITAPYAERTERAKLTRSDFDSEFENRVRNEEDQFREFRKNKLYDYKIYNKNGSLTKSIKKLGAIFNYELVKDCIPNRPQLKASKNK